LGVCAIVQFRGAIIDREHIFGGTFAFNNRSHLEKRKWENHSGTSVLNKKKRISTGGCGKKRQKRQKCDITTQKEGTFAKR